MPSKMYILLHDDVPDGFAPVIAAHASLACYFKFKSNVTTQNWVNNSFRKVVCRLTKDEFDKAKELLSTNPGVVITESALENREVALAFEPQEQFPKDFKYFKLWTPKQVQTGPT